MSRPWCKHYHGMHKQDTCGAGAKFATLKYYGTPHFISACPCFGPEQGECSQSEYPTEEEMAEREAEIDVLYEKIFAVRGLILAYCNKSQTRSVTGAIKCPVCGAVDSLQFSRSGYNGHISAKCQTDGCVAWIE